MKIKNNKIMNENTEKTDPRGYVKDCLIIPKREEGLSCYSSNVLPDDDYEPEALFERDKNGNLIANLQGYAIIPLDDYNEILESQER